MRYRCYFTGVTTYKTEKEEFCLGKCYGYNDDNDGLMLGYTFIMNTNDYKEYRKEEKETLTKYTDYEFIDLVFIAHGSIDMSLSKSDFIAFLDLYLIDYKKVWKRDFDIDSVIAIMDYLRDCETVNVSWIFERS